MPQRSDNTMAESLQKLLADIAGMKVLPDADLEFLVNLETNIVGKLREPIDKMAQAGLTNAPPQMAGMGQPQGGMMGGQGGMPGMGGGAMPPPGVPSGAGAGVAGVRTEPAMPSPDELRRMVTAQ